MARLLISTEHVLMLTPRLPACCPYPSPQVYPERLAALPGPLFGALANMLRYGVGVSGDPEITQVRGALPLPATHPPAHDALTRQRLAHAAYSLRTAAPEVSHTNAAPEALPLALSSSVQSLSTHPPATQV